ncbi:MAG: nucleotide exchange factor GrpE [Patescibacteria group bacterium]|jgi:molecular chaperone GrpE
MKDQQKQKKENLEVEVKDKKNFLKKCKNCEKLIKETEDYKAGWQRAQADYKNLQKEISEMKSEWVRISEQQILEDFIPVYDNFKKAFAHHPKLNNDEMGKKVKNWIDGIGFIMKQFENVLKNYNVEEIKTIGEMFNPEQHEAIGQEDSDKPEHTILKEVDAGYMMKGKIIKVAKVIVAKNKS